MERFGEGDMGKSAETQKTADTSKAESAVKAEYDKTYDRPEKLPNAETRDVKQENYGTSDHYAARDRQKIQQSMGGHTDTQQTDVKRFSDRPEDVVDVSLDQIGRSDINNSADFNREEDYHAMKRDAEMLREMRPQLDQGADSEQFHQLDQQHKLGNYSKGDRLRGYADVYHRYYKEPVALSPTESGQYDIINGRHRIALARELGEETIPARILNEK